MLQVNYTKQFKKDLKLMQKRGMDIPLLKGLIQELSLENPLPLKNRDHALSGDFLGYRECHIQPDWLLVYYIENKIITFVRTGSHSDLF